MFPISESSTCRTREHLGEQIRSPPPLRVIFMRAHKESENGLNGIPPHRYDKCIPKFYVVYFHNMNNQMHFLYRRNLFIGIPKSGRRRSHPLRSFVWVYLKGNNGRPCLIWFRAAGSAQKFQGRYCTGTKRCSQQKKLEIGYANCKWRSKEVDYSHLILW